MDSTSSLWNKERLGCRRERERAHCAAKTAEEKVQREAVTRESWVEERDVRLHRKSTANVRYRQLRLMSEETPDWKE